MHVLIAHKDVQSMHELIAHIRMHVLIAHKNVYVLIANKVWGKDRIEPALLSIQLNKATHSGPSMSAVFLWASSGMYQIRYLRVFDYVSVS